LSRGKFEAKIDYPVKSTTQMIIQTTERTGEMRDNPRPTNIKNVHFNKRESIPHSTIFYCPCKEKPFFRG